MKKGSRELFVVGDRVLIEPDDVRKRTRVGLVLPAGVVEREEVRGGTVIARGPGLPLPPANEEQETWREGFQAPRFMPLQVELGDYALFFRKAGIEITFEDERYLVVPQGAILVVVRGDRIPDEMPADI